MNYIGGINGMNLTPISNYNNLLQNNKSFEVDSAGDFENILNQKAATMQEPIQAGIQMNKISDVAVQNTIQPISDNTTTGDFLNNMSTSLNNGLSAVNNNIVAANKAQEAFAAGENVSVHDVMIASEKANLSLEMAMQLRNKLMSAYSEINNVRV